MADGDTDGYDLESSIGLSKTRMMNNDLQESPICQAGMMFTMAISFRKVRLIFNCSFCVFFLGNLSFINKFGPKGSLMVANAW